MPLAKVEIVIPAGVIKEDAQEDPTLVNFRISWISLTGRLLKSHRSPFM